MATQAELAGQRLGMEGTTSQQPQTPLPLLRYVMAGFICSRSNELANYPLWRWRLPAHSLSHLTSRHQASAVQSDFRGESNPTAVRTCPNVRTSFPLKKQDMKHDDEGHSAVRAKTSAPAASKGCMRRGNATSNLYLLASIAI